jgi:hypothetical protein
MKTIELFTRLNLSTVLSAALFACGGVEPEGGADESGDDAITVSQVGTSPIPTAVDPCRTASADDTQLLGDNDAFDVSSSGSAAYGSKTSCPRHIVDFLVTPSTNPPQYYAQEFLADVQDFGQLASQSDCENTVISVRRYRKSALSSSLVLESTATYRGDFSPAPPGGFSVCSTILTAGDEAVWRTVSPLGTETYRLAVRATKNGVVVPVSASIGFRPQPH